jgi:uncharacterized sulfatase
VIIRSAIYQRPTVFFSISKRSKIVMQNLLLVFAWSGVWGIQLDAAVFVDDQERPNILWLSAEDIGPQLNCYGDPTAKTPAIDALAKKGTTYDYAWSNYPVCAPARTTIITGMYGSTCGAGNMRSMVRLPEGVDMFPAFLRQAGYYCTNNSKQDYNYLPNGNKPWDESSKKAHYRNRESGQPFFAVFNYTGTHESKIRVRPHDAVVDPAKVKLPAYWPDKPEVRQDWAQYYDNIQSLDVWVQDHLQQLEKSGLAENTVVVFFGDHGSGMPRHKRFAGDSGMRVPFVVHVPEKLKSLDPRYHVGGRSDRPVGFIDLAPTMLSVAGIAPKVYMQGHAFLGQHKTEAPKFLYGFRDRMDERPDCSRSIRDQRFIYVRNFMPHLPAGQELDYQMQTPTTATWKRMFDAGELNEVQSAFWKLHPAEELYDLVEDPEETKNLAGDEAFAEILQKFRAELRRSHVEFGDLGLIPEVDLLAFAQQQKTSPRSAVERADLFPLEKIFDVANAISGAAGADQKVLVKSLADDVAVIRYWGLMGILFGGESSFQAHKPAVVRLVDDMSVGTKIIAAELLASFGDQAEREAALQSLLFYSDYRNSNALGAVAALNSIDRLGDKADSVRESLKLVPAVDPSFPRGKSYIKRMLEVTTK